MANTNSRILFNRFVSQILSEDKEEASAIAYVVFEKVFNLSPTDIHSQAALSPEGGSSAQLEEILRRLNEGEPVQYILNEAHFFGRRFFVAPGVLIPRPETEELVQRALMHLRKDHRQSKRVLDIGAGSGCVPITIALECVGVEVLATDVSNVALSVARRNASALGAHVEFFRHDILREELPVDAVDVITSNPPYITEAEKDSMKKNVLTFEPHEALFVPNDDALIFYEAIAFKSKKALVANGMLLVEINERMGNAVASVFHRNGFTHIEILKDVSGKERIVTGIRSFA